VPVVAQAKPIRLIVPYPPGGPLDIVARALADKVRDTLGVVVVENRPGAGGNLGADLAAKAAPDGATIVMGAVATHAINPWLYAKMPYDPIQDFTPITGVAQVPNVLVMNPQAADRFGVKSVADLVAFAKKNPGRINYGLGGNAAQLALLSGQVDLNFDNLAAASANIKAGKLRALAVTTARRAAALPELPTIAESGAALAGFDIHTWFGLFGPARMPADATQRLNRAFVDALASPELNARLAALLAEPMSGTPEAFAAFVRAELAKYEKVVKASGATVE
jgi:tripartite-type tricarboxylate transporter receptor subunit TctC